jgi:hypothetical protein
MRRLTRMTLLKAGVQASEGWGAGYVGGKEIFGANRPRPFQISPCIPCHQLVLSVEDPVRLQTNSSPRTACLPSYRVVIPRLASRECT